MLSNLEAGLTLKGRLINLRGCEMVNGLINKKK